MVIRLKPLKQRSCDDISSSLAATWIDHVRRAKPATLWHATQRRQECFVTITADRPHVTDAVVAATIMARNLVVACYLARTPNVSRPPFTPLLGEAYREADQWRWRPPYLEVLRVQ